MRAEYSRRLKKELLQNLVALPCCRESFLAAALSVKRSVCCIRTAPQLVKPLKKRLIQDFMLADSLIVKGCTIRCPELDVLYFRKKYVERFARLSLGSKSSRHCQISFLQGLFFSHGYMQNPAKGYHFELRLRGRWLIAAFIKTARILKIRLSKLQKATYTVFYCKSSKKITRLLATLGLFDKSLELSDFLATRSILSVVNRQVNSETANINRLISAAEKNIIRIQQLLELPQQEFWTHSLRIMALTRLKFPHDSIEKLGSRFEPPLSKSAVNHRLRRINAIYEKVFSKKEENENPTDEAE